HVRLCRGGSLPRSVRPRPLPVGGEEPAERPQAENAHEERGARPMTERRGSTGGVPGGSRPTPRCDAAREGYRPQPRRQGPGGSKLEAGLSQVTREPGDPGTGDRETTREAEGDGIERERTSGVYAARVEPAEQADRQQE